MSLVPLSCGRRAMRNGIASPVVLAGGLARALGLLVFATALLPSATAAAPRTVCTITVNSSDEKEAFRRSLPPANYRFVELVERGRPDWLASACKARVTCDVLVISAHYDGANAFFSDRLDVNENLTVDELERASCSESCPSLFAQLKEVYLFGCNTLTREPPTSAQAEVVRSLMRKGKSAIEAQRQLHALNALHGETSRDRMRQIFLNVPAIYGFASTAPLGPSAGSTLNQYFRAAGVQGIGSGRVSRRLLDAFEPFGMTTAAGVTERDPHAQTRADMCRFADERLGAADKLAFVHELMQRPVGEARLHLDRIQRLTAALDPATRRQPEVARVLAGMAQDQPARTRLLDYARGTEPAVRARLIDVARDLGWLSAAEHRAELAQAMRDVHARAGLGMAEVNLACTLNRERQLDGAIEQRRVPGHADDVPHMALRACLGSAEDRAHMLLAVFDTDEADVRIAQAYLRHRPITDSAELRELTREIARMKPGQAQVRALEALARQYVADREVLQRLVELFSNTPLAAVQAAVAGILIRADRRALSPTELLQVLTRDRRPAPHGGDAIIDALIETLRPLERAERQQRHG